MPAAPAPSSAALRAWQRDALVAMRAWSCGPFLLSAAPGAGKTRPALELARDLLREGAVRRVAVVCPTTPLTRQWAAAAARAGLHLAPDASDPRPPRDFDGVAVTYARVAAMAGRWSRSCGDGTLVIADEAHHLGEDLAWGTGFAAAFGAAGRWLLLSGTPFRSDATPIPGVRYEGGVAVPDVSYTYADAVRDGICRPVTFIPYDGALQWRSGEDVVEASFEDAVAGREAGRRYRTAISVDLPDGLPRILAAAHERLERLRAGDHRDAGGLVVAADGAHARAIAAILTRVTGRAPVVVLHTEARAAEKLAAFTRSSRALDRRREHGQRGRRHPAPARRRLRDGGQDAADLPPDRRALRARPARPAGGDELALPARRPGPSRARGRRRARAAPRADPAARRRPGRARRAGGRARAARARRRGAGASSPWPPTSRRSSRCSARPAVARPSPRWRPARSLPRLRRPPRPTTRPSCPPSSVARRLRDRRHRLVADLRRRDGRSHAEINRWLNRSCGIRRVDEASIEQLERSVELLLGALTSRR